MARLAWGDRISINIQQSSATKIRLHCEQLKVPPEENLVYRAAEMFSKRMTTFFEAEIFLLKEIPSGAGLAGGSSNAATTLLALLQWYEGIVGKRKGHWAQVQEMASELGSDVGFFLESESGAWCSGRGEICRPIELPSWPVVVAWPTKLRISTAEAYRAMKRGEKPKGFRLSGAPSWMGEIGRIQFPEFRNDFEDWALERYSELRRLKRDFCLSAALTGGMTGSGSAFFGLYPDLVSARHGSQELLAKGWPSVQTRIGTS